MTGLGKGYVSPIAIPPGETIREVLENKYLTQVELAQRLEMSPKHVIEIISGKAPITAETAVNALSSRKLDLKGTRISLRQYFRPVTLSQGPLSQTYIQHKAIYSS